MESLEKELFPMAPEPAKNALHSYLDEIAEQVIAHAHECAKTHLEVDIYPDPALLNYGPGKDDDLLMNAVRKAAAILPAENKLKIAQGLAVERLTLNALGN